MPLVDMPLADLLRYQGRNPRPADFDAYWEDGLSEVPSTLAEAEPSGFESGIANCDDLWFEGVGGARIYAKRLLPRCGGNGWALLMFHGYSVGSGDWSDKLGWVAEGFSVFAMDCRGQGGKSQDPGGVLGGTLRGHIVRGLDDRPERMFYRQVFLDTVRLARLALTTPGVERLATIGASQGGALALACAALEPQVERVVSLYPFLCDYRRVWEMDLAKDAYEELALYFRRFDPTHSREDAVFERLGYVDVQHLAPRIRASVLMATGLMDTITPPSTHYATFNKLPGEKEMAVYPDFGHEGLPGFMDRAHRFLTTGQL